ncbi:hypothetical protein EV44_g3666 [Erysiphe necator]|uniref:Reverse transcriptase domain-containing protein n=1 Tax=Uncinula necator TaxID=52586 RepID=A0A0B1P6V0_UNCNE|nr:hypothetical protein EV44_g3666 [Erysiphe necator]
MDKGYYPACWKKATGAVLRKPGKPDYSQPKAYRVISVLSCLGKISERIIAQRLSYLAETSDLLHDSQIGGRLKKSAIDAALLLTNEIQTNKNHNLMTSALFLDVKGDFDHVVKNQLVEILKNKRLPTNLIAWIASFLSERELRLAFDGQSEHFSKINTGIPQGSPVSPILFLIYIKDLFASRAVKIIAYVDKICLIAASKSIRRNIKILEREAAQLYERGDQNDIDFDLAKTELIHFSRSQEAKSRT